MCGSLAGWFQVAIQAVDWFVPEHHLCIGLRCRFCEVLSAFDHGGIKSRKHKNVRFWLGLNNMSTWGSPVDLVGTSQGSWTYCCGLFACFLRLQSRLVWDVPKALQGRQGMCGSLGRLVSGGYPGRRLVCSRASSMYWLRLQSRLVWDVPKALQVTPIVFVRCCAAAAHPLDAKWEHANSPAFAAARLQYVPLGTYVAPKSGLFACQAHVAASAGNKPIYAG